MQRCTRAGGAIDGLDRECLLVVYQEVDWWMATHVEHMPHPLGVKVQPLGGPMALHVPRLSPELVSNRSRAKPTIPCCSRRADD